MPIEKPPPVIGKIGYYTVFISPTPNSNPTSEPATSQNPVQPPPVHYNNTATSKFSFFWDALTTLQNVHSSLDEYLAHWFGLNQSKYQWALDDYYENNTMFYFRKAMSQTLPMFTFALDMGTVLTASWLMGHDGAVRL